MPLEELRREGLLLPERHWGRKPHATVRSRVSVLVTFSVALLSALLIWLGAGGWLTFVGTAVFLVDLVLILVTTFLAVDARVAHLRELHLEGEVEGLEARPEDPWGGSGDERTDVGG